MSAINHNGPTLPTILRKAASTGLGLLRNRGELFMVELQEEKSRLVVALICGVGALFLAMATLLVVTGIVVFVVPESYRAWVAGGFALLYLLGTIAAFILLRKLLNEAPFVETFAQFRKDRELLEALE